jgi:hypothetical protein
MLKLATVAMLTAASAYAQPAVLPQNNITACLPEKAEGEPGLQIEVTDQFGLWRAGQTIMVSDANGRPFATVTCEGPWTNLRLKPGAYKVFAFLGDLRSGEVAVDIAPGSSQVTMKLEFPGSDMPAPAMVEDDGRILLPPPPSDLAAEIAASR